MPNNGHHKHWQQFLRRFSLSLAIHMYTSFMVGYHKRLLLKLIIFRNIIFNNVLFIVLVVFHHQGNKAIPLEIFNKSKYYIYIYIHLHAQCSQHLSKLRSKNLFQLLVFLHSPFSALSGTSSIRPHDFQSLNKLLLPIFSISNYAS